MAPMRQSAHDPGRPANDALPDLSRAFRSPLRPPAGNRSPRRGTTGNRLASISEPIILVT